MSRYDELEILMQADLDGIATPSQRARLAELLSKDPAAAEEHKRLHGLRELLASVPKADPPGDLTARVMRAVRAEKAKPSGGVLRRFVPSWPGGRVAFPYAYAAAAGAAIGILGWHALTGGGTFGPGAVEREAAATIGSAPEGVERARLSFPFGDAKGGATLRTLPDGLAVDVELPVQDAVTVELGYDPGSVKFIGISNRTGGAQDIQIVGGKVSWSQTRPQRVTVFLVPRLNDASQLSFRVRGAGGSADGTLVLPGRD
jgi:anti-sigma factor RsiW